MTGPARTPFAAGAPVRVKDRAIRGIVAAVYPRVDDPARDVVTIRRPDGSRWTDLAANVEPDTGATQ